MWQSALARRALVGANAWRHRPNSQAVIRRSALTPGECTASGNKENSPATITNTPLTPAQIKDMGDVRSGRNYYDKWSKYTEAQLCAMDEEEKAEREAFEARWKAAAQGEEGVDDGGTGLTKAAAAMATMTPAERLWQARREKEKGNEMFKAKEYPNAINAYSLSLKLSPGVAAVHTNRAAAYLKVKRCEACHFPNLPVLVG
jgi:predicted Zn-dependent protease